MQLSNASMHIEQFRDILRKVLKEAHTQFNYEDCEHEWEPDTLMTIMRCEKCGIGMNTHKALVDHFDRFKKG